MLYILPPPSAKPPSVWDLIINFHRKGGCQESSSNENNNNNSPGSKKTLKFNCRETKKSQRTWCKTSPSDQSHVREIILMTSKRSVSLSRENQRMDLKFSSVFHPKQDLISLFCFFSHIF